jgi:hypothetical protein
MKHSYSFRNTLPAFAMIIYFGFTDNTAHAQVELNTKESNRVQSTGSSLAIPAENFRRIDERREDQILTSSNKELNLRANHLLNELRNLLQDTEKEMIFRESVGPGIIEKCNALCPSIELKSLLLGEDRATSVLMQDRDELKTFMNLISEAIIFIEK